MTYDEFEKVTGEFFDEHTQKGYHICNGDEDYGFMWQGCPMCKRDLGGDKFQIIAYNPVTDDQIEYRVCEDCMLYTAYGYLDMFEGEINTK